MEFSQQFYAWSTFWIAQFDVSEYLFRIYQRITQNSHYARTISVWFNWQTTSVLCAHVELWIASRRLTNRNPNIFSHIIECCSVAAIYSFNFSKPETEHILACCFCNLVRVFGTFHALTVLYFLSDTIYHHYWALDFYVRNFPTWFPASAVNTQHYYCHSHYYYCCSTLYYLFSLFCASKMRSPVIHRGGTHTNSREMGVNCSETKTTTRRRTSQAKWQKISTR